MAFAVAYGMTKAASACGLVEAELDARCRSLAYDIGSILAIQTHENRS